MGEGAAASLSLKVMCMMEGEVILNNPSTLISKPKKYKIKYTLHVTNKGWEQFHCMQRVLNVIECNQNAILTFCVMGYAVLICQAKVK